VTITVFPGESYRARERRPRRSYSNLFGTSSTGVERRYTSNSGHWQNSV
jgi:hypothetical protein